MATVGGLSSTMMVVVSCHDCVQPTFGPGRAQCRGPAPLCAGHHGRRPAVLDRDGGTRHAPLQAGQGARAGPPAGHRGPSARHVATGEPLAAAMRTAARSRVFYLLTGMAALGVAAYVVIGSTYNYLR